MLCCLRCSLTNDMDYVSTWDLDRLVLVSLSSTFIFHIRKKIEFFLKTNVNIAISVNIVFNCLFDVIIVMPWYSWNTAKVDVKHQPINQSINLYCANLISGVMISMVAWSGVYCRVKPKTIKLVFVASPLSTQH